ncbi:AfsR/SARP family transcriptional regulator [Nonomuraea roseoviolacea]|uniref:ATPase/DNA-binding SARP family transcriptional activator n=1 Tax=Nonomuraea roseoviolacea subsp. carminata TaxID=160689 RepID=A0ABT1K263_9ACTN|nr:BTAD domain-containing putative transcriptional regulator [Nonomuraea roseoviolacea]MCP2348091.1 putative ATPase/DNA-binding SARP family transcriptional activator [Nonomuraea roseoviolacea subsp. carminata]
MRIGILGPLQVAGAAVKGARVRALLARLALDPGRVVTADRLIGDLWPEAAPEHPTAALQSLVSRTRREAPGIVASHPAGYALDVPAAEVDAWEFERLVRAGEARAALRLWRGAALADVAAMPFAAGPAARLEELRLTALATRIAADLARHDDTAQAGRPGRSHEAAPAGDPGGGVEEVVAELRALVAEHPVREPFHVLLVRALVAAGRRSEALEAFERARAGLADELGADPGPALREAHLTALREEPAGTGATRESPIGTPTTPERSADTRTTRQRPAPAPGHVSSGRASRVTPGGVPVEEPAGGRMPARMTSFVGRSHDLSRLRALLTAPTPGDGARLVTLVGPGGAGKTRLAVETADTFDGTVWLVELAAAGAVRTAVEGALRTTDAVTALRGARNPLVVLDNCEHLVEDAAREAHRLLGAVPGLRILATSREPLDIPGETLHRVLPLEEAAAVELFRDRAAAARPDARIEARDAARICRELDGVPLAIELAAARLRTMPVAQLVRGLGDRLAFRGGRTAEPRHRTLRAVIDWSWELLSDAERELLRAFTVFAGGASADAVVRVCGPRVASHGKEDGAGYGKADGARYGAGYGKAGEGDRGRDGGASGEGGGEGGGDVLDVPASLVDKSLIGLSGDRYTMLETIRQYAAADLPDVRRAHARYYTLLAEEAGPGLRTGGQLHWLAVLDAEQGNLDAALERTDDPLRLFLARLWPWSIRGRRAEAAGWAAEVLARVGGTPPAGRELAHGLCRLITGTPTRAPADDRSRDPAGDGAGDPADDPADDAVRLSDHPAAVASFALMPVPPPDVVELAEATAERLRDHPDPWTRAAAQLMRGLTRFEFGAAAEAGEPLRAALAGFRETGDRWGLSYALHWLSLDAENQGDDARAIALAMEGARLAGEIAGLEAPQGPILFLARLGRLQARTGDLAGAAATLTRAEEFARRAAGRPPGSLRDGEPKGPTEGEPGALGQGDPGALRQGDPEALRQGDPLAVARVLHARAELARRSGDPQEAARLLHSALTLLDGAPPQFEALVHVELARVSADPWPPLRRALELMDASPDRTVRATVLEGAAEHCDPPLAAELAGAARALRGGAVTGDTELLARCRDALGEDVLQRALDRGAAIPHPERYALSPLSSP